MKTQTVLVVAAHPDDEILGVGGTIRRHVEAGDSVHSLIVAEGATSRADARDAGAHAEELAVLQSAAAAAAGVLGVNHPMMLGFPDNRMDGCELLDIVKAVQGVIDSVAPDVIYTHHAGDLNIDHGLVFRAVMTASRPLPGRQPSILTYETVSSTEWAPASLARPFQPDFFVDIEMELDMKLDALRAYSEEMRPFPHARSLEAVAALARWRGASAGMYAAEAFESIRRQWYR